MPRPRFEKLDKGKRERILETAAREFAARGYDKASLNAILARSGISKGAAYYYFDDKADLYTTVIHHYAGETAGGLDAAIRKLTQKTFWPALAAMYREQLQAGHDRPWAFRVLKSARRLSPDLQDFRLGALMDSIRNSLSALVRKGQVLGQIRTDLPREFLVSLFIAVDDASDEWLLDHWKDLDEVRREAAVSRTIDLLQRLFRPAKERRGGK